MTFLALLKSVMKRRMGVDGAGLVILDARPRRPGIDALQVQSFRPCRSDAARFSRVGGSADRQDLLLDLQVHSDFSVLAKDVAAGRVAVFSRRRAPRSQ